MAKLPNRLVIEITNTDKVDELGNPVIGFESKDYAECVIEELEKIVTEIENYRDTVQWDKHCLIRFEEINYILDIVYNSISELKGEQKIEKVDCDKTDCNNCINHNYCDYE